MEARGYTAAEADAMLQLCGPRLRLLVEPLQLPTRTNLQQWTAEKVDSGISAFEAALDSLSEDEKRALLALIQRVAAEGRVAWSQVPPALQARDLTKIFYISRRRDVKFQSQLHKVVWEQEQGRFDQKLQ
jgi:hypothetical protein